MSGKNQKNRGTILMRMFYPDRREKSAYTIDYADLYRKGYRGVIFDIDNTLVPHGAPATKEAAAFLRLFGRLVFPPVCFPTIRNRVWLRLPMRSVLSISKMRTSLR